MKVMITQSNYIPWKGFFDGIALVDLLILYDDMQYTRRDWRNRNKIKTPRGSEWLTIPVEAKGKYYQKIHETKVSDPGWGRQHWKTICYHYAKAPYLKEIKEWLEPLYLEDMPETLSEINRRFIEAICSYLGIQTEIRDSREFTLAEGKTERLVDLCEQVGATDYYSGPAAQGYLEEELFKEIRVHYFDYSGYIEYPQLFGDFEHSVSILDLLFNAGKESKKFMKYLQEVAV